MTRIYSIISLFLILVAGGVLAACGGSDLAADPVAVVNQAKLPPPGPNVIRLKLEVTPAAGADGGSGSGATTGSDLGTLLGGPITIEANIEGDPEQGATGDAKVRAGAIDIAIAVRADKTNTWVQVGSQWYDVGSPLGIDFGSATLSLDPLRGLIRDPKAIAVEDVGGVECDRITGTINPDAIGMDTLAKSLESLPLDLSALQKGKGEISIWVARADHVIRRIQITSSGSGDAAAEGSVLLDLTVVPGKVQPVTAPTGAKPISDLLLSLLSGQFGDISGLLGGLGDLGNLGALTGEST